MKVTSFSQKIDEITKRNLKYPPWTNRKMATDVFTIEDLKNEFTEINSIRENWDNIEKLLQHPIFREDLKPIAEEYLNLPENIDDRC